MAASSSALCTIIELLPNQDAKALLHSQDLMGWLLRQIDLESKIGTREQR